MGSGDWIVNYIGLPYLPGGRTRAGLDCWGLVRLVAVERFGYAPPAFDAAVWRSGADDADIAAVAAREAACWMPVQAAEAAPGDVLLLRHGAFASHVGIVCDPGHMLHIVRGTDSAREPFGGLRWGTARIAGIYRWQGSLGQGNSGQGAAHA